MKGLLLVNLGTPDAATVPAVRRFLREFLSDPYVIDIHPVARFFLLYGVILPFRPKKSAAVYQQVWSEAGSPLLVHGRALEQQTQHRMGSDWKVSLGMRYGNPSLSDAYAELVAAGVDEIVVLPLYPQHALSSTVTTIEAIKKLAGQHSDGPLVRWIPAFYGDEGFIAANTEIVSADYKQFEPDHVLFSFHGLPERQVHKTVAQPEHCQFTDACCATITKSNANCYRAQSFHTARIIAERMGLQPDQWSVGFQSRLGRTPWIQPYTDEMIPELARHGVHKLLVSCPSFVADCLETLEEIGIRAKADFEEAGGETLHLSACINSSTRWVEAVASLAHSPGTPI